MRRIFCVLAVTLLASCAATDGSDEAQVGPSTSAGPAAILDRYTNVVEIDDFFDFSATTLDGDEVDGDSYRGRQLALWFWAPW